MFRCFDSNVFSHVGTHERPGAMSQHKQFIVPGSRRLRDTLANRLARLTHEGRQKERKTS